jgi:hypothetical protein
MKKIIKHGDKYYHALRSDDTIEWTNDINLAIQLSIESLCAEQDSGRLDNCLGLEILDAPKDEKEEVYDWKYINDAKTMKNVEFALKLELKKMVDKELICAKNKNYVEALKAKNSVEAIQNAIFLIQVMKVKK